MIKKLGIVAFEFPPDRGGIQEHARGLVRHLRDVAELTILVRRKMDPSHDGLALVRRATADLGSTAGAMGDVSVDAWLVLNAGMSPLARLSPAPVFAYVHGADFTRPWLPLAPLAVRAATLIERKLTHGGTRLTRTWRTGQIGKGLRQARGIIANSRFVRDRCIEMFSLPEDDVVTIHPGIAEERYRVLQPRAFSRELRILTVARLTTRTPRKNVEGLLRSLATLKDDVPLTCTIVGDGDDRPRLESLASTLGIASLVRFRGDVDDDELAGLYARSDVFALAVRPDPDDIEGFGMVYAEAAAAGLPCLATNAGGVADAVSDGVTGILIESATPDAIGAGLRRFLRERDRFEPQHIQDVARAFSAKRTSRQLFEWMSSRMS